MRSLAERVRFERILRIVAFLALAAWMANAARPAHARRDVGNTAGLRGALPQWTRAERVDSVRVQLDTAPDAATAAWLAALRGAGVRVAWAAPTLTGMALETFPSNDPAGGIIVLTSAPSASGPVLSDALGPLDTLPAAEGPTTSLVSAPEGGVSLTSGLQSARADVAPGAAPRRVFVAGAAGWEAKFVIAALEERGWQVDAHLVVAPGRDVRQGSRAALDTSRHAAAVLLDSAAVEVTIGVERFVRAGGGVVLGGDANRASRAAPLLAWRAGRRETAPLGTLPGDTTWRGLARVSFDTIAGRPAVTLERRNGRPVVIARRHFAGRVVAVGYDQTWRWRMAGGDLGGAEHRAWWSRVVASVAARPPVSGGDSVTTSAAPLASLYRVLGPPTADVRVSPVALSRNALSIVVGLLLLTALLAEWLLRRARGAR